ncbi:MAG: hypothetical protein M1825_004700 [Sarcosagium campestre]|nr:MAG: hypothetical protein M1825_004700 [Sarcosagium campestre]
MKAHHLIPWLVTLAHAAPTQWGPSAIVTPSDLARRGNVVPNSQNTTPMSFLEEYISAIPLPIQILVDNFQTAAVTYNTPLISSFQKEAQSLGQRGMELTLRKRFVAWLNEGQPAQERLNTVGYKFNYFSEDLRAPLPRLKMIRFFIVMPEVRPAHIQALISRCKENGRLVLVHKTPEIPTDGTSEAAQEFYGSMHHSMSMLD